MHPSFKLSLFFSAVVLSLGLVSPTLASERLDRASEEVLILQQIGDHASIGYRSSDIWYDRLRAVEALDSGKLSAEQRRSLTIIASYDPDWRIRNEAATALRGERTRSMIVAVEASILQRIGDHPSIGYRSSDIWYDRLRAVEALDSGKLSAEQRRSLTIIATNDPDERIRDLATSRLK